MLYQSLAFNNYMSATDSATENILFFKMSSEKERSQTVVNFPKSLTDGSIIIGSLS